MRFGVCLCPCSAPSARPAAPLAIGGDGTMDRCSLEVKVEVKATAAKAED